ncbi:MAG: 4Fe-4S dicluster domain-containing protein [Candidatus Baldrarchaeia archaeon]
MRGSQTIPESVERAIKEDLRKRAGNIETCYQCGMCVGDCPAARFSNFNIRRIVGRFLLCSLGDIFERENIWDCLLCFECAMKCPRSINPALFIINLRYAGVLLQDINTLLKMSKIIKFAENIMETGLSVPLTDNLINLQREVGIPPRSVSEDALRDVKRIFEKSEALEYMKKVSRNV